MTNESRPKAAPGAFGGAETKPTRNDDLRGDMRRRRDAALRLPPLSSGRRDPSFDWGAPNQLNWAPRSGPSRSPLRVEFDSPRGQALVRGFGGGDYCRLVGGRGLWLESRRGWSTTARTARDVIAAAERDGRLVIITEAGGDR